MLRFDPGHNAVLKVTPRHARTGGGKARAAAARRTAAGSGELAGDARMKGRVMTLLMRLARDRNGATALEYGLLVGIVTIGLIASVESLRDGIITVLTDGLTAVEEGLAQASGSAASSGSGTSGQGTTLGGGQSTQSPAVMGDAI